MVLICQLVYLFTRQLNQLKSTRLLVKNYFFSYIHCRDK